MQMKSVAGPQASSRVAVVHGSRHSRCSLKPVAATGKGLSLLERTNRLLPQSQLVSVVKWGVNLAWKLMVRELAPQSKDGAYKRPQYTFNGRIGSPEFPAESGRYVVYLGNACPWCHRVHLALVLRGLLRSIEQSESGAQQSSPQQQFQTHITVVRVIDDPTKARRGGWVFGGEDPDPVWGAQDLWEVYDSASPGFTGRCTAPLLVDRVTKRIVSNESSDIVRMLNELHLPGCTDVDLYPDHLRHEIDQLNDKIYTAINNGVYRSGFATTQAAYDEVQSELWAALEEVEQRLSKSRFLTGPEVTECDLRLLPTILRFDAVYATIFKCTRRRISHYPALSSWMRDMWQIQVPGSTQQVPDTIDINGCRTSYFTNLFPLNPSLIVPAGPTADDLKLSTSHGRGQDGLQHVTHRRQAVKQPAASASS